MDIPELELGEAADEGLELVVAAGGERGAGLVERLQLRVDHGGEEADEEVEEVDAEAVGDDVEALFCCSRSSEIRNMPLWINYGVLQMRIRTWQ